METEVLGVLKSLETTQEHCTPQDSNSSQRVVGRVPGKFSLGSVSGPLACIQFACDRVQSHMVAGVNESHVQKEVGLRGLLCIYCFVHCEYAGLVGRNWVVKFPCHFLRPLH